MTKRNLLKREVEAFKNELEKITEAYHDDEWRKVGYTGEDAFYAATYRAELFFARIKELI
jgi:hypothetical protein